MEMIGVEIVLKIVTFLFIKTQYHSNHQQSYQIKILQQQNNHTYSPTSAVSNQLLLYTIQQFIQKQKIVMMIFSDKFIHNQMMDNQCHLKRFKLESERNLNIESIMLVDSMIWKFKQILDLVKNQISCKQLFESSRNTKLMVGLLFEAKDTYDDDPFLAEIIKNAKGLNQLFTINANLSHLVSKQKIYNFWFYKGSVTIPPCTNGKINWIIPQKIFQMSKNQLDFFQKLYPDGNWRNIQQDKGNQISYATALPSTSSQF